MPTLTYYPGVCGPVVNALTVPGGSSGGNPPPLVITRTRMNSITGVTDPAEQAADPVNGNVITNTGRTLILVDNTDTVTAHVVTFRTVLLEEGLPVNDEPVTIPAGARAWFTGFDVAVFGAQMRITVDSRLVQLKALELGH